MPEFFLELLSEEIPARMQAAAAGQLEGICAQVLKPLQFKLGALYSGPRRLALKADIAPGVPETAIAERGPRKNAPEQALAGFLRKHGAAPEDLTQDGDFWVLNKSVPGQAASSFIANALPEALAKLPWPKSMRWGTGGDFTWVRPLRSIICLLDGAVIPFSLGPVTTGDQTFGHRVLGPGPFGVSSAITWEERLREHHVIASRDERRALIAEGLARKAAALGLAVAPDETLLDEVTGLVEWPVALIGRIDDDFMGLPPEVRELSMKINQKYFALRDARGAPAPHFGFVANLAAEDLGEAIVAGNERVLRARLADARHFWDLDLKTPLSHLLPELEKITFHPELGTQLARADRLAAFAGEIALQLGGSTVDATNATNAGALAKTDLVTGMVGEFPELQGIMGGYYAAKWPERWDGAIVGEAIRTHYQPKGPSDAVPRGLVSCAVALADKLDTLREFFRIGEKPTGSGDPYALRRCALGVIRIILENELRLPLKPLLKHDEALFDFLTERLRVKLRSEGQKFDILDAVLAAGADDDLVRLMKRVEALTAMLGTADGKNLLAAYKRAANILKIENAKDGPHNGLAAPELCEQPQEIALLAAMDTAKRAFDDEDLIATERFIEAMRLLASLREPIDAFFEQVTVNAPARQLRQNRLALLARFRDTVHQVADFSRIEG